MLNREPNSARTEQFNTYSIEWHIWQTLQTLNFYHMPLNCILEPRIEFKLNISFISRVIDTNAMSGLERGVVTLRLFSLWAHSQCHTRCAECCAELQSGEHEMRVALISDIKTDMNFMKCQKYSPQCQKEHHWTSLNGCTTGDSLSLSSQQIHNRCEDQFS